jgi:pimeloyl-ACP methyl ester carboxylesterase
MTTAAPTARTLTLPGPVELTVDERGEGQPFLVLHGGAGPLSMARFSELLAERDNNRVLTPTHPGFGGTTRPDGLSSVGGLAELYRELLDSLDLADVTVIGNSIGGWIAAELALLNSPRVSRLVLLDAVGIELDDHRVADVSSLSPPEIMALSFHDPVPFLVDPATLPDAQRAIMAANGAALAVYAGTPAMADPTLHGRLSGMTVPTLVVWGESDRIVDPDYGRAYATAIPGAHFQLLTSTGHVPQLESPQQVLEALSDFLAGAQHSA